VSGGSYDYIGPPGADPTDLSQFTDLSRFVSVGYVGYYPWQTFCWTPGGRDFADQWADTPALPGLEDAARRAVQRFEQLRLTHARLRWMASERIAAQVIDPRSFLRHLRYGGS
jgi:hypothetical protein